MKTPKFTDSHRFPIGGYRKAAATDVKSTFRRIRAEQRAKEEQEKANQAEAVAKVKPLIKGKVA